MKIACWSVWLLAFLGCGCAHGPRYSWEAYKWSANGRYLVCVHVSPVDKRTEGWEQRLTDAVVEIVRRDFQAQKLPVPDLRAAGFKSYDGSAVLIDVVVGDFGGASYGQAELNRDFGSSPDWQRKYPSYPDNRDRGYVRLHVGSTARPSGGVR